MKKKYWSALLQSALLCSMFLFVTSGIAYGVTFTVTTTADNPVSPPSGSLRWAINQANTSANAGNAVIIDFNAPGLVLAVDIMPPISITNGSINFKKSSLALVDQGVNINYLVTSSFFFSVYSSSTQNPSIQFNNLKILNWYNCQSALDIAHSTNVQINYCTFGNAAAGGVSMLGGTYAVTANGSSAYYSVQNLLVDHCTFNGYRNGLSYMEYVRVDGGINVVISNNTFDRSQYGNCGSEMVGLQTEQSGCIYNVHHNTFIADAANQSLGTTWYIQNPCTLKFNNNTVTGGSKGVDIRRWCNDVSNNLGINVEITNNNFSNCSSGAVTLRGPKKYFNVNQNHFTNNYNDILLLLHTWPSYNASDICDFEMVNTNSLGYTLINSANDFISHTPSSPSIFVYGYNPGVLPSPCKFVGLNVKGRIEAYGDQARCNIRENKIVSAGIPNKPVTISNGADASNTSPVINSASLSGTNININYTISGITTTGQGNYYVDFYKSNANGDFVDYLGHSTTIGYAAINGTHSITLPAAGTTSTTRIAATVTSVPNLIAGINHGTSEPGYFLGITVPNYVYNTPCNAIGLTCQDNSISYSAPTTFPLSEIWYSFNSYQPAPNCTPQIDFTATGNIVRVEVWSGLCDSIPNPPSTLIYAANSINSTTYSLLAAALPAGSTLYIRVIYGPLTGTGNYSISANAANDYPCISCSDTVPCEDCMGSFIPEVNKSYIISAWVREENAPASQTEMLNPYITLEFPSAGPTVTTINATGTVIDGWQKIHYKFTVPNAGHDIRIMLNCTTGNCLFDDVRVFPEAGMMKSYVYDPVTLRFVAELDEQNYASFYEYDEEGKLTTVKKETERGVMTIKESRNKIRKN